MVQVIVIPILSALIGWITNVIAIRSLFYPRNPIVIPHLGWRLQGLLPKRRDDLARDVGRVIEQELLPIDRLLDYLHSPEMQNRVADSASDLVTRRIRESIPVFVPAAVVRIIEGAVHNAIKREAPAVFEKVFCQLADTFKDEVSVADLVEEQMRQYELGDLERLITRVASKELRQIEWLGGFIGFIIGLFQLLIIQVFR